MTVSQIFSQDSSENKLSLQNVSLFNKTFLTRFLNDATLSKFDMRIIWTIWKVHSKVPPIRIFNRSSCLLYSISYKEYPLSWLLPKNHCFVEQRPESLLPWSLRSQPLQVFGQLLSILRILMICISHSVLLISYHTHRPHSVSLYSEWLLNLHSVHNSIKIYYFYREQLIATHLRWSISN